MAAVARMARSGYQEPTVASRPLSCVRLMNETNLRTYSPDGNGAAKDAAPARAPLTIDLDVDVCVIGGGVAGLTVAREIARRGWSVAVLEAERIPWCALDRSAGIVAPGFAESIERIVDRVGLRHAKELWALASDSLSHVRRTAHELPGVRPMSGHLAVTRSADEGRLRARAAFLKDEFSTEVDFWSTGKLRAALSSTRYWQALHFPNAFHLNPLAYVHALAAAAEQAGARIFEYTHALHIDAEGVRKRVDTASARVRAGRIVLTGARQIGQLLPQLDDTILTLETHSVVTAPLGERLSAAMPFQGSVAELDGDAAFHPITGDRLVWSGRITTRDFAPERMGEGLRGDINRAFPQLGAVEIAHAWSAPAGYAVHRMPQIGELKPGLWLANAFGRQGLNTSTMAGLLIASAIADGDDRWRLFSAAYGLSWNGGWAGRALVEAGLIARRARNRLSEFLARNQPVPKAGAELPARTEAPPIVPPEHPPVTLPASRPELEPVLAEMALAAEPAAPPREAVKPKRVRKAAPKSGRPAKKKPKTVRATPPEVRAPADVIVVRKAPKRRTKQKAVKAVPAEPSPSPAIGTDLTADQADCQRLSRRVMKASRSNR